MTAAKRTESEKEFLASYRPKDFPRPSVSVDLVVLTIIDAQLRVLLVRRAGHPFKGQWALPGGFVRVGERASVAERAGNASEQGEDVDAAARRELEEETGLSPSRVFLEQLYTFGKAGRDPRMRVISVAYYALVRPDLAPIVQAGGDADGVQWLPVEALGKTPLAFDHQEIAKTALERVRGKLEYSHLAFDLVPLTFTIPELRTAFAIVLDKPQDPGNFRRRFNPCSKTG